MMRRISLALLGATAIGVVLSQGALAADILRKAPAPAPLPPPIQDWSGIYVGLEGGYGWGKQNFGTNFNPFFGTKGSSTTDFFPCNFGCSPDATIGSVSQSGWLFGGFVGAQKQWGSWVLGIEADFDAADIKGSSSATRSQVINVDTDEDNDHFAAVTQNHNMNVKIDELGTVRGKIGWAWSPNWMIYGTGGMAFAHVKNDASFSFANFECNACLASDVFGFPTGDSGSFNGSSGASMFGWTVGAGLDYKWQIDQNSAVILGVEYLHYQFAEHTLTLADNVFGSGGDFSIPNTSLSVDVVKGRISYLFSIH
jgi:outer membrane immunogenic protein